MKKYFIGAIFLVFIGFAVKGVMDSVPNSDDSPNFSSGDPLARVILPESFSVEAQAGQELFQANCASCHGDKAQGKFEFAPPLVHEIYEPSHHGDLAFFMAAQNGVQAHHWPFGNMPPVAKVNEAEIAKIVAFVRELQRANGIN